MLLNTVFLLNNIQYIYSKNGTLLQQCSILYKFKCYIQVDYFIPAFALIAAGTASL